MENSVRRECAWPAAEPVYLVNKQKNNQEEFYIRRFASTVPLTMRETVQFVGEHWKQKAPVVEVYNLMVGDRTAEEVKIAIGTALPLERELTMDVRGRDLIAGLPRTIPMTSSEVMEAMEPPLQQIIGAVRLVLEQTPPELSSDIIDKGMVMSGGGSLLRNIDKLLTQVTGVPCHVADDALNCVARGTGLALEHFDFYKKYLGPQM